MGVTQDLLDELGASAAVGAMLATLGIGGAVLTWGLTRSLSSPSWEATARAKLEIVDAERSIRAALDLVLVPLGFAPGQGGDGGDDADIIWCADLEPAWSKLTYVCGRESRSQVSLRASAGKRMWHVQWRITPKACYRIYVRICFGS